MVQDLEDILNQIVLDKNCKIDDFIWLCKRYRINYRIYFRRFWLKWIYDYKTIPLCVAYRKICNLKKDRMTVYLYF